MPNAGATGHYLKADAPHHPPTNMLPTIYVGFPNGQTMQSNKPCLLDFPVLPNESFESHILPSLSHSSLVLIGKLCNYGFTSLFKANQVTIKHNNIIVIQVPIDIKMDNRISHSLPIPAGRQHCQRRNRSTMRIKNHLYQN